MDDIRGYTIAQVRAFGAAAERARSRDLADAAWIQRAAAHYDKAGFGKVMKELSGE